MNEHEPKPQVAPPAGYKPPSLPTLAALGIISAATLAGCIPLTGAMIMPVDEEKQPLPLADEALPTGGESQPVPLRGFVPEAE